ncbi:MAG: cobalt-precorrin-5B (C(1))-methyltransferase CbiD [Leptolyngbyaceae cyanobacterium bins.59]|nr:cobalt-precorrin-5B (C(1))-methyltransferase CbiD [Leptolyngbyaceae cyanobacterium bins.59]
MRSGYTLPVFACAAAIAALRHLRDPEQRETVSMDLLDPAETVEIGVEQVARLSDRAALAITRSDPGDNLDLTRHTPIWAKVEWGDATQPERIQIEGGEGLGRHQKDNQPAIYAYARRLFAHNLDRWLSSEETLQVTIILPEGRQLAERTSNAAFGVVEGLSLLGSSGISQPLSAPGQLEAYREELQQKAYQFGTLVFCVGENGLDLAARVGIQAEQTVKTANWLGPLLVEAGMQSVKGIVLFGYHGKLLKLAGGVFHTHHHVADARQEILTAYCASQGLPTPEVRAIFASATAEAALQHLRSLDTQTGSQWVGRVYRELGQAIDRRSQKYIYDHSQQAVRVGSVLFDRDRHIINTSKEASLLLNNPPVASVIEL